MTEFSEVLVNGRWPVVMPPHRAIRPWWNHWEKERLLAMRCAIRPGDLVLDVGAEQGDLPSLWGTWGADVAMIEPAAQAWPCIRATWDANVPNRAPLACFAGFCDATNDGPEPTLGWPDEAFGEFVEEPGFRHLDEHGASIPRTTVDTMRKRLGLRRVDVLTMDVEGSEFHVLRGAEATLAVDRPTVFISLHGKLLYERYGEMSDDLLIWLYKVAGYDVISLGFDHEEHLIATPRP